MSLTIAQAISTIQAFGKRTPAQTLRFADACVLLTTTTNPQTGKAYSLRDISALTTQWAVPMAHTGIRVYVNVRKSLPADITAEEFVAAYRDAKAIAAGRKSAPKKDAPTTTDAEPAGTPGDSKGNGTPVRTLADALAVLGTLTTLAGTFDDDEREAFAGALLDSAETLSLSITLAVA